MIGRWKSNTDSRKSRLFAPIVALTLGMLFVLLALSAFLLARFNATAMEREQHVAQNGLDRQVAELKKVVATQVQWDEAVLNLDNRFNRSWADFNVGSYLFVFNGFSRIFVIDGEGVPVYAAINGQSASANHFSKFSGIAGKLVPTIRAGEVRRGPIVPRQGKDNVLVPPIQASSIARIDGQVYFVSATLVQPDFGRIKPRGPRAPVVVAAAPINPAFLLDFSNRYLLGGLELFEKPDAAKGAHIVIKGHDGVAAGALAWNSRQPGTELLNELALPVAAVFGLLSLLAVIVMKRGDSVVNELIASEARALHLAYHDTLTRLPNRALLFERLRPMLAELETSKAAVAVLCVDLDRFKEINDTLGHHAGDLMIETVASRLRKVCGDESLIARLGGDEFVVLCEAGDRCRFQDLADTIIQAVRQPVESEYGRLEVGCSIGFAIIDRPGIDPFEALRWADLALYRSKESGRMQVTCFEPEMDLALRNRRSLESDLRGALTDGTLHMVYQPQVNRRGEVIAVEALVRWTHPERGVIPPGVFVPLAEECGLILGLGEFVLRQVFAETRDWTSVRIAINVSAVQLRAPGFAALVTRLVASAGVDPSRYEIELTETALLGEDPATAANVEALKRLGFSIALDDFGTGYSSLSVLQRFSVDKIKIDRSFVSCLGAGGESEALIDAMIRLARALKLTVIAEGVETEAQLERLYTSGCGEFQGHLIGLPMSAQNLAQGIGETEPEVDPERKRAAA